MYFPQKELMASTPFPAGLKRAAVMIVLRSADEFLLLKRNKAPNAGLYAPIGGKIEPYERPIDTAIRETAEEAGVGLQKSDLSYAGVLTETSPAGYNWLCFIFKANIERIAPPHCDEGTLEWIPLEQISTTPMPPTDLQIYQLLLQGQHFAIDALYDDELRLLEMREEVSGQLLPC